MTELTKHLLLCKETLIGRIVPCRVCGSKAHIPFKTPDGWVVTCDFGCNNGTLPCKTEILAVDQWNRENRK